jgi:hypothetical protein
MGTDRKPQLALITAGFEQLLEDTRRADDLLRSASIATWGR